MISQWLLIFYFLRLKKCWFMALFLLAFAKANFSWWTNHLEIRVELSFFLFSLVLMRTQWKCASYFKLLWGIQRCRGKTWIVPLKHVKRSWIYSFFCSFRDSLVHCPEANRPASCCIFEYFPFFPFPEFNNTMKPPSRLVRFAGFVKTCSQIKDKKKRERTYWMAIVYYNFK